MRLIDADKIPYKDLSMGKRLCYAAFADDINRMPTIEERKKGKWIDYSDEGYIECPFCHCIVLQDGDKDEMHYCFSCGAELR